MYWRQRGVLRARLAVKKCKVVSLKAAADGPKRCPRRTLSAVSPRCSSRRRAAACEKDGTGFSAEQAPLPLTLDHSVSLSLSSLRAKQSIRVELEVTTGHRLNQSKPHFISLPPTRALPPSLLSLFPFLSPRISRSSPRLFLLRRSPFTSTLSPSCLFQAWIIHRPPMSRDSQAPERRSLVYVRRNW